MSDVLLYCLMHVCVLCLHISDIFLSLVMYIWLSVCIDSCVCLLSVCLSLCLLPLVYELIFLSGIVCVTLCFFHRLVFYVRGQYIGISRLALFSGIQICVFCLKVRYMFSFCLTFVVFIYFSVVITERLCKLAIHAFAAVACMWMWKWIAKKRVLTCYKKNQITYHTSQRGKTIENIAGFYDTWIMVDYQNN